MPQPLAEFYRHIQKTLAPLAALGLSSEQLAAESRLLLESIPGCQLETLYSHPEIPIEDMQTSRIQAILDRRLQERQPIQYLLGQASFYGLTLTVTPDVLIPRPETELLVAQTIDLATGCGPLKILDIGTGSGCIALALGHILGQQAELTATDSSGKALAVARQNAQQLGLSIRFEQADLWPSTRPFDLIVSNPPYVAWADKPSLTLEVLKEPEQALFPPPGQEALFYYQRLAQEAPGYLTPGGQVLLELGHTQGASAQQCFEAAGFQTVHVMQDHAGHDRILSAFWPSDHKAPDS